MSNQRKIEIRVPAELGDHLKAAARHTAGRESVVFTLTSHMELTDRIVILVRKVIPLPDSAYLHDSRHGAKWSGSAMLPVLNEAMAGDYGVCLFHVHQDHGPVELSQDDYSNGGRLLSTFRNLVGLRPHGSVVFSSSHMAGIVQLPGSDSYQPVKKLRWLGKTLKDIPSGLEATDVNPHAATFHRQVLLIGSRGQMRLQSATVAVAGLCGGGSHTVQGLAHLGVGHVIGIDHDYAEESNRHRMVGLTWLDVLLKRRKTAVMKRLVRRINRQVKFTPVPYPLPDQRAIDAIKQADVVIGCLDNFHARADLQDLSWRYLIPLVDIGLTIIPASLERPELAIGGNVATFIPGQFCAWCAGFLSQKKLDEETGGRPRSYFEGTAAQAQVISFNGVLANQAVSDVLQLLTGFAPHNSNYSIRKFDGVGGTLENWRVRKDPSCAFCERALSAGEVVWRKA